ncbi:hypothetical protein [Metallosphaera hakonensis]|nr:hypothetical protein [Metallosphaera hakonensis]
MIRTLTVYRVTRIYLVKGRDERLIKLLKKITYYSLKPPYLKKYVKLDNDLSKAGLLQPVNVPYHVVSDIPVEGEIRKSEMNDLGLKGCKSFYEYSLIIDSEDCKSIQYAGIFYEGPIIEVIDEKRVSEFDNLIMASRSGVSPLSEMRLLRSLYQRKGITLLVGPPEGGIKRKFPSILSFNFLEKQGVSNVRSMEALFASLTILNSIIN